MQVNSSRDLTVGWASIHLAPELVDSTEYLLLLGREICRIHCGTERFYGNSWLFSFGRAECARWREVPFAPELHDVWAECARRIVPKCRSQFAEVCIPTVLFEVGA